MSIRKERLTVTVDPALIRMGHQAVRAGHASSLSGWVNLALAERVAKERRLKGLAEAVAAYEAEFGAISADEVEAQTRADQRSAIVVRGRSRKRAAGRQRR